MPGNKPLDARLARRLVYPLRNTRITPNHLTALRLLFGIAACLLLSRGTFLHTNLGAACFVISNFLDHTDGELARITGKMSKSGHYFDLAADAIVNILLFIGIGIGMMNTSLGALALPMGIIAGIAVAAIFHMRLYIEETLGKDHARQPNLGYVEVEDILYLIPLITVFDQLRIFLVLASIGAPLFALWVLYEYLSLKYSRRS